jgi:ParB family transcriptional regulator, chromosome partitioning protein
MAGKQGAYLSKILTPGEVPDVLPEEKPGGSTLLARSNALARLSSGELKQITLLRLDPAKCRVWRGNGRDQARLTLEACQDLIDAIKAEGGQKVPALVRRLKDDPTYDYEVIYGSRRLWSIAWLKANDYPDMTFLAEVREVDDETAFRLADIENRTRKDISDRERAQSYSAALSAHYAGNQARMADRMNISRSWLSKLLAFASVPPRIFEAFEHPEEISLKQGYRLAQAVAEKDPKERVLDEVKLMIVERQTHRASGEDGLKTNVALERLFKAAAGTKVVQQVPRKYYHGGKPVLTVVSESRSLKIQVHKGTGAGLEDILGSISEALKAEIVEGNDAG